MMERMSAEDYRALVAQPPVEPRDIKPPKKARKRAVPIKGVNPSKEPPSFLSAIMRLMAYSHPRNLRIKAEERLAIDFANSLRAATIEGKLRCVWTHPANEIAGRQNRLAQIRYTIAKAMGLIDGTSDYLFLWHTGSGALEAKIGKNSQQPNQIDFEIWCKEMGVPYRTFTTVDDGLSILAEWGVLNGSTSLRDAEPSGSDLDN
jgi:hypothetical protein